MNLADEIEAVQLFTSLLSIVAVVGALALLVARLLAQRVPLARDLGEAVSRMSLPLAWLVAAVSMAGSLYFSERANFAPCLLCWYQRIAMYPLAVILLVAMLRRDRSVAWYAVPLAAIGALIAGYHRILEWRPSLDSGGCDIAVPCTAPWFTRFGFVTLATMAFFGFVSIIILLTVRFPEADDAPEEELELGADGAEVSGAHYAEAPVTEE